MNVSPDLLAWMLGIHVEELAGIVQEIYTDYGPRHILKNTLLVPEAFFSQPSRTTGAQGPGKHLWLPFI